MALRVQETFQLMACFLHNNTVDIWGQIIFDVVAPMLCKMFISISGFYSLDARNTCPAVITKNISRHHQMSPGRPNYSQLRATELSPFLVFCEEFLDF